MGCIINGLAMLREGQPEGALSLSGQKQKTAEGASPWPLNLLVVPTGLEPVSLA